MSTTTEMDSIMPSYCPVILNTAKMLTMTITTHKTLIEVWRILPVAISNIKNAKVIAMTIPRIAPMTNYDSLGINIHESEPCIRFYIPDGAILLRASINSSIAS